MHSLKSRVKDKGRKNISVLHTYTRVAIRGEVVSIVTCAEIASNCIMTVLITASIVIKTFLSVYMTGEYLLLSIQ